MGAMASQITSLTIVYSTRRRSKKTSKPRATGLCAGNSPDAGEFPAQMASNGENVSIWWRHHETCTYCGLPVLFLTLLLTRINSNPSMDNWLHPWWKAGWNVLSIPNFSGTSWSWEWIITGVCDYLFMLGFKLIHVSVITFWPLPVFLDE